MSKADVVGGIMVLQQLLCFNTLEFARYTKIISMLGINILSVLVPLLLNCRQGFSVCFQVLNIAGFIME